MNRTKVGLVAGTARRPDEGRHKRMDAATKAMGRIPAERQMRCSQVVADASDRQVMSGVAELLQGAMAARSGGPGQDTRLEPGKGGNLVLRDVSWVPMTGEVTAEARAALERALPAFAAAPGSSVAKVRVVCMRMPKTPHWPVFSR